jgi:hypothetical protein
MIRFQSDHNLASLDPQVLIRQVLIRAGQNPAGLARSEISGARPRRPSRKGKNRPSGGRKLACESRFVAPSESAFTRLEKPFKSSIYSISYPERLCARRIASFMAQLTWISAPRAPLIRDTREGLT